MSTIKAIIFDKDGTLHDTEKVFWEAWTLAAKELNVPDIESTIRDCTGATIPAIADYWAQKYPHIPFEDYLPRRQYHFQRIIGNGVPVKAGAHELLTYLKHRGIKVGLATSTDYPASIDHLRRSAMEGYFDAIITGDMVKNGKPAPDIYLLAAERLGVDPQNCIGVEDSLNGVRSICAAGMRAVMVPDMIPPTKEIEGMLWRKCASLAELIPILEKTQ